MSEHTPGPWELHHQRADMVAGDCDWSLQTEEAGAFLLFCHHPMAPSEANARLIAAAPDMLEALDGAYRVLCHFKFDGDRFPELAEAKRYMYAAIAKATNG